MAGLAFNLSESFRRPAGDERAPRPPEIKALTFETPAASEVALRHLLDKTENERASKFNSATDRAAFVVTRANLRRLLGRECGNAPADLRFRYTALGKPLLDAPGREPEVSFSVSHTTGLGVIAVARNCALGIDAERLRPMSDLGAIAPKVFSASVAARLCWLPVADRDAVFLRCWTAGEALGKATGGGIAGFRGKFPIAIDSDCEPCVADSWNCDQDNKPWILVKLDLGTEYVATLACRSDSGFPIVRRVTEDILGSPIGMP